MIQRRRHHHQAARLQAALSFLVGQGLRVGFGRAAGHGIGGPASGSSRFGVRFCTASLAALRALVLFEQLGENHSSTLRLIHSALWGLN